MKNLKNFLFVIVGNISVIILVATAVTLISMFKNLGDTIRDISRNMIKDRLNLTQKELDYFFDPVRIELDKTRKRALNGMFNHITDLDYINTYFYPMIENSATISSVIIANELGDEVMLLKNDSIWINRITRQGSHYVPSTLFHWSIDRAGVRTLISEHRMDEKYDPRTRPWYKMAMADDTSEILWTSPYYFFTSGKPGITATIKWKNQAGVKHVFAIDVLLSDISRFTTTTDVTTSGKVIILSEKLEALGLPKDIRFQNKDLQNSYVLRNISELGIPLIDKAVEHFQAFDDSSNFHSFNFENEIYWAGAKYYNLDKSQRIIIGVVVPISDFSNQLTSTRQLLISGLILTFFFLVILLYTFIMMKRANKIIRIERDKNERLLLNTLPEKVVDDLKKHGQSEPRKFEQVTVCVSDIVGFTQISSQLDPKKLIMKLNDLYTAFDEIMIKYGCERIKTMGDAYMAVCGMPENNSRHAEMMILATREMLKFINEWNTRQKMQWQIRIGMHSGVVVGGIVGVKKYIYDIFGDTINTAFRMESLSQPMRVNISENTFLQANDSPYRNERNFSFEKREPALVKGKGMLNMYFVHFDV
jgi:class 3 adenylate cyclase